MGNLYFLIGLPRSGKTTVAHGWARHKYQIDNGTYRQSTANDSHLYPHPRAIVSTDAIRKSMGHNWNGVMEPHVWAIENTMVRALLQNHDVLVDDTHTSQHGILSVLKIDPEAQWCYIDTHPTTCKDRAMRTNQDYLNPVIDRMVINICKLCNCALNTVRHELPRVINSLRGVAYKYKLEYERICD